jgi:serine/threonine protein kinase
MVVVAPAAMPATGRPVTSVAALAAGLAEGLSAIHAAGVIHRDLKPSNVLLASDGPRIIDFGIASAAEATALTGTGFLIGSPGFMSPEQAQGHRVGPASDIFSLGAVLGFAATGEGPFGTGDTAALLYRVVHGKPDLGQVPGKFRPLLRRNLAKDPAHRPTAGQFLADLTAAYPSAPNLTGDLLPAQALAASTAPVLDPDADRHEPAAPGARSVAVPHAPPTQETAAPQVPAAGPTLSEPEPSRAAAGWPLPAQALQAHKTARRRRLWPWVAAATP